MLQEEKSPNGWQVSRGCHSVLSGLVELVSAREMAAMAAEPIMDQAQAPEPADPPFLLFFVLEDIFEEDDTRGEGMRPRLWRALPMDMLEKILLRLPARSQARFRAVCKAWLNLLTSEPFLTHTAALAFSRDRPICAVSYSEEDYVWARDIKSCRFKVHKMSMEWLPSKFRDYQGMRCQQGLILTSRWYPNFIRCILNPTNQTFKVLPPLDFCTREPVSGYSVEGGGQGEFTIRVYADGLYNDDADEFPVKDGFVYDTEAHEWRQIVMPMQTPMGLSREIGMVKDLIYFAEGYDEIDIHMYSSKDGNLVRRLPPWSNTAIIALMSFCVIDDQVVTLAFSTSKHNLCEVRQVNASNTKWVLVNMMPYDVLWPNDDQLFYLVRNVELVGLVAFLTFLGFDKPLYTRDEFDDWIGDYETPGRSFPKHGFLVAYHVVQGSWEVVSDRWPLVGRAVIQLNPALSLA